MPVRSVPRATCRLLLVALACAHATGAAAATAIAGGNVGQPDTNGVPIPSTWTAAGSPYVLSGDVTIPPGATLTVEAGTVVRLAGSDGFSGGRDHALIELAVYGALAVNGAAQSPVTFEPESGTTAGSWYGILVDASAASASISNAVVVAAKYGVRSEVPGTALSIQDSTFRNNETGLYLPAGR